MFVGVIVSGTSAYHFEGWTLSDAFFMVIITVFGIGYEEVEPVKTGVLRAITIIIIIAGTSSAVYFVGAFVRFITEGEIGKAMEEHRKSRDIETIDQHIIVCGYGRIGQTLARELAANGTPFLVVDNNPDRVELAHHHGWLALQGDAGDEVILTEAHVERALALATVLPSDMVNVFITLTARNMRADLRIIARAEDPASERKLKQAGANEVILPAFVGGMQIAHSITHPSLGDVLKDAKKYLRHELDELGIQISEHVIIPEGVDDRKTLQQLLRGVEARCLVLGVRRPDGTLVQHPESSYRLEANDVVMMLSHGPPFKQDGG